jgi:hypothetical protein
MYYIITGTFYSKTKSYFEDRRQSVKVVNNDYKFCFRWGIIKHGELQGSILGQFLFLRYINDIMKITSTKDDNNKSKLVSFPDDTRSNHH